MKHIQILLRKSFFKYIFVHEKENFEKFKNSYKS